jgi:7-cyano-7-deazaguanine synthase
MSVIIYSGGIDSTVLLYQFKSNIKLAISFDYGSKHNDREYQFAKYNTNKLGINHIRIPLAFVNDYFKSDLLKSGGDIPLGHYEDLSMKKTVVPFRNGIMLSIAAGIAESYGCKKLYIANHFGDHAIYPDCRKNFIEPMAAAIKAGTYAEIELVSPYVSKTKREIGLIGKDFGVDFSKTWSCYRGGKTHCGKCGTCVERKEALNGFDDTEYLV